MCGWTDGVEIGDHFLALALALGDGVTQNTTETSVAVGSEQTANKDVLVTVHTHPELAVDWRFKSDGDSTSTSYAHTVDAASAPRLALQFNTSSARVARGVA